MGRETAHSLRVSGFQIKVFLDRLKLQNKVALMTVPVVGNVIAQFTAIHMALVQSQARVQFI